MSDVTELRSRLEELADGYEPRRVSVGLACARGRRAVRMRRAAAAAGSAAALGVVVTLAAGGLPAVLGSSAATHAAGQVSRRPSPRTAPALDGTDPLLQTASFGWLPAGLAANGYLADSQSQPYFQLNATAVRGSGPDVTLTVYSRGGQPALPDLPGGIPATPIPATPVNGGRAYWVTEPTIGSQAQLNFELRWEYAPGRWADLQATGMRAASVGTLAATARKIATQTTFSRPVRVPLPMTVSGLPAGLVARRAVLNSGRRPSALIYFSGPGNSPSDSFQIGLMSSVPHELTPNTTIGRYRAYEVIQPRKASAVLYVFGVHGFDVQITADGHALRTLPGGVAGLFARLKVYDAGDPSGWTLAPVRG